MALVCQDLIFVDPEDETPVRNFVDIFERQFEIVFDDQQLGEVLQVCAFSIDSCSFSFAGKLSSILNLLHVLSCCPRFRCSRKDAGISRLCGHSFSLTTAATIRSVVRFIASNAEV